MSPPLPPLPSTRVLDPDWQVRVHANLTVCTRRTIYRLPTPFVAVEGIAVEPHYFVVAYGGFVAPLRTIYAVGCAESPSPSFFFDLEGYTTVRATMGPVAAASLPTRESVALRIAYEQLLRAERDAACLQHREIRQAITAEGWLEGRFRYDAGPSQGEELMMAQKIVAAEAPLFEIPPFEALVDHFGIVGEQASYGVAAEIDAAAGLRHR